MILDTDTLRSIARQRAERDYVHSAETFLQDLPEWKAADMIEALQNQKIELLAALKVAFNCLDAMRDDSHGPMSNPYVAPLPMLGREMAPRHDFAKATLLKLDNTGE